VQSRQTVAKENKKSKLVVTAKGSHLHLVALLDQAQEAVLFHLCPSLCSRCPEQTATTNAQIGLVARPPLVPPFTLLASLVTHTPVQGSIRHAAGGRRSRSHSWFTRGSAGRTGADVPIARRLLVAGGTPHMAEAVGCINDVAGDCLALSQRGPGRCRCWCTRALFLFLLLRLWLRLSRRRVRASCRRGSSCRRRVRASCRRGGSCRRRVRASCRRGGSCRLRLSGCRLATTCHDLQICTVLELLPALFWARLPCWATATKRALPAAPLGDVPTVPLHLARWPEVAVIGIWLRCAAVG